MPVYSNFWNSQCIYKYELVLFFYSFFTSCSTGTIISEIVVELSCDSPALLALQSTNDVFRVSYNSSVKLICSKIVPISQEECCSHLLLGKYQVWSISKRDYYHLDCLDDCLFKSICCFQSLECTWEKLNSVTKKPN